ncbi:hypothetical protein EUGRSUZ_J01203 [Eucalyptus grandis]|uniref:Uncharacterized protein n=2 Tax=Eucalyptus grandis TaxID=71139 RepID=A0ACC3J6J0_EUCGR|nr:hypothetical protein EUGRSUZ_J01203 [Eucalyptus grandis]
MVHEMQTANWNLDDRIDLKIQGLSMAGCNTAIYRASSMASKVNKDKEENSERRQSNERKGVTEDREKI